jgi:bis(5'-nucleosyl)-tetraphosphatase (symmetrical)
MRRIFIGDVQGCARALKELLNRVGLGGDDHLYFLGDLVNRNPASLAVLRLVRGLDANVVLGNHDLHLLRRAAGVVGPASRDSLDEILRAPDREQLLDWLAAKPVIHVEPDLVVVHGGLHPRWSNIEAVAVSANAAVPAYIRGSADERIRFATQARYCDPDGTLPEQDDRDPGPPYRPWDQFYRGERMVVFGHWSRRGLVIGRRVRGLDTGCVWGRSLTAWIAESDEIVQVSCDSRC